MRIINIRAHGDWLERAADYFSSKWGIDRQLYHDSMTDSLTTDNPLPRWYLMLTDADEIIGCFGLIENDFMVRDDLRPWLCALYVAEQERGKQLGAALLAHGRGEAAALGFERLYLNTDHVGYYERYGWEFMGMHLHQSDEMARVYAAGAVQQ